MRTRASQRGYHDDFPWWKYNPLDVECPECDAEIGEPCWSKDRSDARSSGSPCP